MALGIADGDAGLLATWAVMVTVPATDGQSAQVTALATAVGTTLTGWLGELVAILLAGQTFSRTDYGVPGAQDDLVTTVTNKTVYVDVTC